MGTADPTALCGQAIAATERATRLPPRLLRTIAVVESGRRDPRTGGVGPWPWTINAEGAGLFFDTKDQAVAAVQSLQSRGVRSIDVGCMQVNLMYHAGAFASLAQAFEPQTNVSYAARFLNQLFALTSAWPKAAAAYHSQTPAIGADYERRVMALWGDSGTRYATPATPPPPSRYTAELAERVAAEAAERARLYAEMRVPEAAARVASRQTRARGGGALLAMNAAAAGDAASRGYIGGGADVGRHEP